MRFSVSDRLLLRFLTSLASWRFIVEEATIQSLLVQIRPYLPIVSSDGDRLVLLQDEVVVDITGYEQDI